MPTYNERADIDNVFGSSNVSKWADLNNNGDVNEIATRIVWANSLAYTKINSKLRGSRYSIPFKAGSVPADIVNLAATWAGLLLHDGRGVADTEPGAKDPLSVHRQLIERDLKAIMRGRMRLDATDIATSVPQVLAEEE